MTEQELAEWLEQRCGKLTASRMCDAMAFKKPPKKPPEGYVPEPMECRSDYMRELLAERVTFANVRHLVTDAMRWGLEQEESAKAAYELATGEIVRPSRFYDHPSIDMCGATPDGELAGGYLLETKCPTTQKFIKWALAGVVPEEHKPQMILQCAVTGRRGVKFVAYDPRINDRRRQLFIRLFEPTAEDIASVEAAAKQFLSELEIMEQQFNLEFYKEAA